VTADGVVEGYLEAVATQDWDRLRASVTDDVVREGPYGDVYSGVDAYVEFLATLMPTLRGYAMDVSRVTYVDGGRRAFAELSETVEMDGRSTVTPEALVFDLEGDGRISRVTIYTRRA
jgi:hypothetical protein